MGKVLSYSLVNESDQSLVVQFWGGKDTQNYTGDISGTIKPGETKYATIEKDAGFGSGMLFDGYILYMVSMSDDVTYQEGPEEVTLPKKKVGKMEFLARPTENWTRGYEVFSLPAHYPHLSFSCTMKDNVAVWTISGS